MSSTQRPLPTAKLAPLDTMWLVFSAALFSGVHIFSRELIPSSVSQTKPADAGANRGSRLPVERGEGETIVVVVSCKRIAL